MSVLKALAQQWAYRFISSIESMRQEEEPKEEPFGCPIHGAAALVDVTCIGDTAEHFLCGECSWRSE